MTYDTCFEVVNQEVAFYIQFGKPLFKAIAITLTTFYVLKYTKESLQADERTES
jgi:hypothetical protein